MREILSISLDSKLKDRIEQASKLYHLSKSEIVKKAVEKYLLNKELNELRDILIPYSEKAGYFSDEDVFKEIS